MNTKTILLYILSLFIIISTLACTESSKNNKVVKNQMKNVETTEGEDFVSFLESFSHMPTFQRQRVLFPLEATVLDPGGYEMKAVKETINYEDWFLLDFSYDSSFRTRQMDRYEQDVRMYNDSALIELRGIDNGIYANYLFIKSDGKWFLKTFTDVSY